MKIKELIAKLQMYDPEMTVVTRHESCCAGDDLCTPSFKETKVIKSAVSPPGSWAPDYFDATYNENQKDPLIEIALEIA